MTLKKNISKSGKRRIFLVDDHPVTRSGLSRLINDQADLKVCGETGRAADALSGIEKLKPDLVVIDLSLAKGDNGLELIKDLAARNGRLLMLALSMRDETLFAERVLRAGAKGYVMKDDPTEHVMLAIRTILNGDVYLSKAMTSRLLKKIGQPHAMPLASEIEQLSDREIEIFRLLGQGHGTRQVAKELHLSPSTVQTHCGHIKVKLDVKNASELLRRAVEWVISQSF